MAQKNRICTYSPPTDVGYCVTGNGGTPARLSPGRSSLYVCSRTSIRARTCSNSLKI